MPIFPLNNTWAKRATKKPLKGGQNQDCSV